SKQGRKKSKPESTLDDSTIFDDQDADHGMEYMETEEVKDEGRQSSETEEVKFLNQLWMTVLSLMIKMQIMVWSTWKLRKLWMRGGKVVKLRRLS
ncbi:hypothetical protein Tco_0463308, partial [Tanacetum coccineum]